METRAIHGVYQAYIAAWNRQDAKAAADLATPDCLLIGFDGSTMRGKAEVETAISQIFAHHQTAKYITIIKGVTFLSDEVAVLDSVVGMVPPGAADIKPEVNALQVMTAKRVNDHWQIAILQNTPAAFHGRPELSEKLTRDLRNELSLRSPL